MELTSFIFGLMSIITPLVFNFFILNIFLVESLYSNKRRFNHIILAFSLSFILLYINLGIWNLFQVNLLIVNVLEFYDLIEILYICFISFALYNIIVKKQINHILVILGVILLSIKLLFISLPCFNPVGASIYMEGNYSKYFINLMIFAISIISSFILLQYIIRIILKNKRLNKGWRIIQIIITSLFLLKEINYYMNFFN